MANLASWNICTSATVLLTGNGDYDQGLTCASSAYEIAARLGNEPRMSSAAVNRAICELRLGKYTSGEFWSERATLHVKRTHQGWREVQPAYYWALSLCMLGENRRAQEAIERIDRAGSNAAPEWCQQVSPLLIADILWATGDQALAIRTAREALAARGTKPLLGSFAGLFGRWIAHASIDTDQAESASKELRRLTCNLEAYDIIDRAEIATARILLEQSKGRTWPEGWVVVREVLLRLPPAVESQIRRLGTLGS